MGVVEAGWPVYDPCTVPPTAGRPRCDKSPPPIGCVAFSGSMPASRAGAGDRKQLSKAYICVRPRFVLGADFFYPIALGLCRVVPSFGWDHADNMFCFGSLIK